MKNASFRSLRVLIFLVPLVSFFSFTKEAEHRPVEGTVIKTVVIDAGHGGKDPGCHGASAHEKNVCLSMALSLGAKIKEAYPNIKVVYTRDKDVFVELDDRAKIANKNNADLFICIHANSASASAFGTETYVLGLHRTEAQQKIAERENSTIYLESDGGEKYKDFDLSPDALIARQLQLSVFLDQSILFAEKLQAQFKSIGRFDRGVKQAGFLVLYKTTMPSVLIETGFLTNPDEEKHLSSDDGQEAMAAAMFAAFENYRNQLEGISGTSTATPNTNTGSQGKGQDVKTTPAKGADDKVVFRVQIETSQAKLPSNSTRFKGISVYEYQQDNLYKYAAGEFVADFNAANSYKNDLRSSGFPNAFVVAFQNGQRISLEKAIKLAKK